ncbi:unnamed protein product [Caenorhabditis angaria]|uniref:7TM GPCR serpentine receptor class x (Srx) domain-containing protein n=1 Tax=Caenorhabditis angaria TaxID=860376 RepID=A0A9P1IVX0_9PELO|nr:unnamed protein product [Caenorhabditis angaria]
MILLRISVHFLAQFGSSTIDLPPRTFLDLAISIPHGCFLLYSLENLTYIPADKPDCNEFADLDKILEFDSIVMIFLVVINLMTFTKIMFSLITHRKVQSTSRRRIRQNLLVFLQTILQDSLVFIDAIFTFKLSDLSSSRLWVFTCSVLIWEIDHFLDGFIMFIFNDNFFSIHPKKSVFEVPHIKITIHSNQNSRRMTFPF